MAVLGEDPEIQELLHSENAAERARPQAARGALAGRKGK